MAPMGAGLLLLLSSVEAGFVDGADFVIVVGSSDSVAVLSSASSSSVVATAPLATLVLKLGFFWP